MNDQISEKKEFIEFLKDNKYVLILLGILLFAFVTRIYFFSLTSDQPVWWDEADYLAVANKIGKGIPQQISLIDLVNPRRPFLMSLIWGVTFKFGFGESSIRFLQLLLSMFGVLFTYLIGKEMFNKKVGLISSFLMSCFWVHLFFTNRLLVGLPASTFWFGCAYFFWKGYVKNKGSKYILLAAVFLGISVFIRAASLIMVIPLIVFILMKDKVNFIKNKNLWLAVILFLLVFSPFIIWVGLNYGNPFKKFTGVGEGRFAQFSLSTIFRGNTIKFIKFFPTYLQTPFLIIFLFGLLTFLDVFLGLDLIFRKEGDEIRKKIFVWLWILVPLLFFGITTSKAYMEPRYLIYIFPAVFIITAVGLLKIYNYIAKHNKRLAYIVIIIILFGGMCYQLSHTNQLINTKKTSYFHVKDAALWVKEHTKSNDVFMTQSIPQSMYYSERACYSYNDDRIFAQPYDEGTIKKELIKLNPKYMIISLYEYHPQWAYDFPEKNNLKIVQSYMLDQNKPALIIYEL